MSDPVTPLTRQAFDAGFAAGRIAQWDYQHHQAQAGYFPDAEKAYANWPQRSESEAHLATLQADNREICICSAIVAEDGRIFRGHRHVDALRAAGGAGAKQKPGHEHQGFITSRNRYVNREEAAQLQIAAGIESADKEHPYLNGECYSEDLY